MKKIFLVLAMGVLLSAKGSASYVVESDGGILSMMRYHHSLYLSQDNGCVRVYDLSSRHFTHRFELPLIVDFLGDKHKPQVYFSDTLDGKNILIVSQGSNGSRELHIISPLGDKVVLGERDGIEVSRALWVNTHKVLLGLMSNEIALYDLKAQKFLYKIQPSQAAFSDLIISEDKKIAYSTAESGVIDVIEVASGKILKKLEGVNKDNVYQLVKAKNIILSAGQDRKMGIYRLNRDFSVQGEGIEAKFLVYAVGIDTDAKYGAMMYDEEGGVALVDLLSHQIKKVYSGGGCIINTILFYHQELIASCDGRKILFWKLEGL
ncbi:hypothetical protein BKH46_08480 [Helicobacter sp. 12S02634-8]|uniref:nitrate reductase n=1 Tax=Helicobacter sp. 12S02634-8 TaxID=1476199 RepID=UPI000BA70042|nr:nitrate reductase [Helicobacter sp. 12S02634-8]PAF46205.1 hypothetical protein BKH46_08480 [Helicobacter sp. 12S02634-8]